MAIIKKISVDSQTVILALFWVKLYTKNIVALNYSRHLMTINKGCRNKFAIANKMKTVIKVKIRIGWNMRKERVFRNGMNIIPPHMWNSNAFSG